jgi:hypothetical protein
MYIAGRKENMRRIQSKQKERGEWSWTNTNTPENMSPISSELKHWKSERTLSIVRKSLNKAMHLTRQSSSDVCVEDKGIFLMVRLLTCCKRSASVC